MKLAARYSPVATYVRHLHRRNRPDRRRASGPGCRSRTCISAAVRRRCSNPRILPPSWRIFRERFRLLPNAEIAIESDPRTLTDAMIQQIGLLGFNRASFGVQEFDPKVQAAINRIQPPEMVERAILGLRAAGVPNINFDLIYGLPHQTTAALCRTVEQCVTMKPDRIALFGYAHVPWVAKNQRMIADDSLPNASERAEQAKAGCRNAGGERLRPDRHRSFRAARRQPRHCRGRGTPASKLSGLHQRRRPNADRHRRDLDRPDAARLRPERQRNRSMVTRRGGGKIAGRTRPRSAWDRIGFAPT